MLNFILLQEAQTTQNPNVGGGMSGLIMIGLLIVVFYFFMIRPQQKRAKKEREMREKISRGDKVITAGGIHGVISEVADNYFVIEVDKGVNIRVAKTSVYVLGEEPAQR